MSAHKIQFPDKIRTFYLTIPFLDLSEEFHRDSKASSNDPW